MEMYKSSKIFVAGHKGLVGSAIVRKLQSEGYDNLVLRVKEELDLRNQDAVNDFFKLERPEFVFLAAAKVGGINYNAECPADFIYDNLMIQSNVIDAAYRNGVKKLLFLGSACIYPKVTPQPIKEEYLLTAPLEPTNEGYALAKIAGLKMCDYYRKQFGFKTISLMPANLYGINDNFNPEKCHVIPGMITKFNTAKLNGTDVTFWGDGTPTREFLYVDDLADACLFLMQNYDEAGHINVGSDVEIEIKELCEIIRKEIGYEGNIIWDETKPNGTPRRKMDNSKLFSMGWRPKVDFNTGLAITIDWFLTEKDRLQILMSRVPQ
jgi:GDP-L-fucose synthase